MICQDGEMTGFQHVACHTASQIATSSLPLAQYLCCAEISLLEKPRSFQMRCPRFWRTAHMEEVEVSVTRASGAIEYECSRRAVQERLALWSSQAVRSSEVHETG
jgi:hypothetical protein